MLWLQGDNGESPPAMWNEDDGDNSNLNEKAEQISDFGNSLISGSSKDMHCDEHPVFTQQCEECVRLKSLVERYQTHRNKFTCKKKGKVINIAANEGHGRLDGKIEGEFLTVPVCRFNFPKNPIDKTEFILAFPKDHNEEEIKKAKLDYKKIRKYLLRLTNGDDFDKDKKWINFKEMTFYTFLFEVGMFEGNKKQDDKNACEAARKRYLTALRCEVRSSGLLLLRRDTEDVFTNNYNIKLLQIHEANEDMQFITDEYAVAEYVSDYCTKLESGTSALLRNINDEAVASGENAKIVIGKLAKALDKGRECSIQEAIYRLLGLSMSKFSSVVRFINTNHPDRRDGLLRSDIDTLDENESVFHNSLHDYYQDRPFTSAIDETDWNNMTLAQFVASYNIAYTKSSSEEDILRLIKLRNNRGHISRRKNDCVVRYFLKYENDEEFYRALCILFFAFRDERKEIHSKNVQELYEDNVEAIEMERRKFEKHRGMVELIKDLEKQKESNADIEENEDKENLYIEDETTLPEEIEDFEKEVKSKAKQAISNYNEGAEKMSSETYLDSVISLNEQQRKIFNDFVERINDTTIDPFYLYIGGEAGTGKSFLLKLMIEAVKLLPKHSGQDLDKPHFITLAPTGVAAYLVNGTTIESGLGIQPQKKRSFQTTNPSKNSNLRFLYEDLQLIFLDEVSMTGSDMLARINFRMQEIMGNSNFMGGVSMVCCGDFGQLPPVLQPMIWQTSHLDGRIELSTNHWDENFYIYYLDQKMRSQDSEFSTICDLVRKGISDKRVIDYMQQRVKECPDENNNSKYAEGKLCIIVTTNKDRDKINSEKLHKLLPNSKAYVVSSIDQSTNVKNPPPLSDKLPLTQTGQLEKEIVFKEGAPVMVTSNHKEQKHRKNGIVNGSRGYIDSIQPSQDNPDVAEVIWVRFHNDKTGKLLRGENRDLLQHHKPKDDKAVPILKQKKQFSVKGSVKWLREQFPLTLCYAITAHKSQGQTLDQTIIDFRGQNSRFGYGSFYTALSRVKFGSNVFLKSFKPEYIKANPAVEKKISSMKLYSPYIFKKVYLPEKIYKSEDELKIGYINIDNLLTSKSDIFLNEDPNLLHLDLLAVADTRLDKENNMEYLRERLSNWNILQRFDADDNMKHMGLLLLQSNNKPKNITIDCESKSYWKPIDKEKIIFLQCLKVHIPEFSFKVAFVYIRQSPTEVELTHLTKVLKDVDLFLGDLNLDPTRSDDLKKLNSLCVHGHTRVLNEVTTTHYNQLDHILFQEKYSPSFFSTSFRNFSSDHHAISMRIPLLGNTFSDSFLQARYFNKEEKTGKRRRDSFSGEKQKFKRILDIDAQNEIWLQCLHSPNWLTSSVIDRYLQLLQKEDSSSIIFQTAFQKQLTEGFEKMDPFFHDGAILEAKRVLIPMFDEETDICFLVTLDKKVMSLYDPVQFKNPQATTDHQQVNKKILELLKEKYVEPLYAVHGKRCPPITLKIFQPPDIVAIENEFDCGIFMTMFVKHLLKGKKFSFVNENSLRYRDSMRSELLSLTISHDDPKVQTNKRKPLPEKSQIAKQSKPSFVNQELFRTFTNLDGETCWVNCCLQLVLAALDHNEYCAESGSLLWDHLISLKNKGKTRALSALQVRNLIIRKEVQRIQEENILPQNRLFLIPGVTDRDFNNYLLQQVSGSSSIGQQDGKDFFLCLKENKQHWPDVYSLFEFKTVTFTTCSKCQFSNRSDHPVENVFLPLDCPTSPTTMSDYINRMLNSYELREEWRDEGGCNQVTTGKNYIKIQDVSHTDYLVFCLNRLLQIDGQFHIIDFPVPVGGAVSVTDDNNVTTRYSPVTIIHYEGHVTEDEDTRGHYMADVLDVHTNKWFRTSDNSTPRELEANELSNQGYIYLYKRM